MVTSVSSCSRFSVLLLSSEAAAAASLEDPCPVTESGGRDREDMASEVFLVRFSPEGLGDRRSLRSWGIWFELYVH